MAKFPIFHYTHFDSLLKIFEIGQLHSRDWLIQNDHNFNEISIDPDQTTRGLMGLTNYVPMFVGYYKRFERGEIDAHLRENYDDPIIYNGSYYGSLNKNLQHNLGQNYERIILLLIHSSKIIELVNGKKGKLFSDIAIKGVSEELSYESYEDLNNKILECVINNGRVYCEIDFIDDNINSISIPDNLEAMVVDNEKIKTELITRLNEIIGVDAVQKLNIFIDPLPRDPIAKF